jgi:restriction system protein
MKLKMAENSLFAILLRSRWWISFVVAAAIFAVAMALLPREYAPFGAMGALPFLIIGGMALSRQWGAPSASAIEARLTQVQAMSWAEFSAQLEAVYRGAGYAVTRISGGADFMLEKGGRTTLVSAKRWKAAHQGVEPLRELDAARQARDADFAVFVSLAPLTDKAIAFGTSASVRLIQGSDLAVLLKSQPR